MVSALENDHTKMQEHLNRYYFPHLSSQKINLAHICQYANSKFANLPNKNVLKAMNELKGRKDSGESIDSNLEFQ